MKPTRSLRRNLVTQTWVALALNALTLLEDHYDDAGGHESDHCHYK